MNLLMQSMKSDIYYKNMTFDIAIFFHLMIDAANHMKIRN